MKKRKKRKKRRKKVHQKMMEKKSETKNFMLKIFSQFIRQIFLMIATSRQKSRAHGEKNARIHLSDVERLIEPRFF